MRPPQRYELAALHHSITSSARPSNGSAIVMPSALAVSRLIANPYLVGACTEAVNCWLRSCLWSAVVRRLVITGSND